MASTDNIQQLTLEEEEEAGARALQLVSSCVLPFTLKAAIELRLLDIIVEAGPEASLSPVEIAARLPTKNPQAATTVDRILRLLAANRVVSCSTVHTGTDGHPSRRYGAAPICKYLTKNEGGVSLADMALVHQDKVFVDAWYYLKDSVLEGVVPLNSAYGMPVFDYIGTDPRFNKVFNAGMRGHSSVIVNNLLRVYGGFDDVEVLVDVGGNDGATLQMITSRHRHIKGINYDLPHVISGAKPLPGVKHVHGNMFETVPSGDAVFLKWILHDWSDEHCMKILKNCWKALPQHGKIIVVEHVLPAVPEPTANAQAVFQLDLAMLVYCVGGKERTEKEFKALATEAGFPGFKASHVFAETWVMEFIK
ncbi:flavone O-methyltransferase 1-like isoform X1 [Musa acuminata AAA Group]|uniref:flavone O-methyltransferase 1-like isoform X1 n=1 Tax=Musa acuminata AAA Group TaxID=214697 RepID=UPI0031D00A79